MSQDLKDKILNDLRYDIDILQASSSERSEWLREDHSGELHPVFSSRYTDKSLLALRKKDHSIDRKLEVAEDKERLSGDAKKKIRDVRKTLASDILVEKRYLDREMRIHLKTNPRMRDLSDEDYETIMEDHKRKCSKHKKRLAQKADDEIRRIISRDECPRRDETKKGDNEKRDREEIEFLSTLLLEEKSRILELEEGLIDQEVPLEDLERIREENICDIKKELETKELTFMDNLDRRYRMSKAEKIQVDGEQYSKLMTEYNQKMKDITVQSSPSVNWNRTLKDLDTIFIQCPGDWNQFIELVLAYWCYLADLSSRKKFDKLIGRYASLYSEIIESKENDILYNEEVVTLRSERDELLLEVRRLDKEITQKRIGARRKKPAKPVKKVIIPIMCDELNSRVEPVKERIIISWR